MITIGCHLPSSDGFLAMGNTALSIGANTFAFFTRNPRGGGAKAINLQDIQDLKNLLNKNNFGTLVAHAPYTLNPCASDERVRNFAYMALADDMKRMELLPGNYYNLHPGCHVGQGADKGIELTAALLNDIITPEQSTVVLLETMAGKGSEIGRSFEEIAEIIDKIKLKDKVGVCLDTCHIYDAGYDIKNDLDKIINEFDAVIGLHNLKALHINDSMNDFASHKDRHEKIGNGKLGFDTIAKFVTHPKLSILPMILETPNELEGYSEEISKLRNLF